MQNRITPSIRIALGVSRGSGCFEFIRRYAALFGWYALHTPQGIIPAIHIDLGGGMGRKGLSEIIIIYVYFLDDQFLTSQRAIIPSIRISLQFSLWVRAHSQ